MSLKPLMKKLSCCLAFLLTALLLRWLTFNMTFTIPYTRGEVHVYPPLIQTEDHIKRLKEQVNMLLKNYYNSYPRCTDIKSVTDSSKTKIELKGASTVRLGGIIRLNAYLFDGYGKAKTVGGDHLRARLFTLSLNAYTAGNVYDHNNGTYSIQFAALWSGPAIVEIELLYPREIIAAAIHTRREWAFSSHLRSISRLTTKVPCDVSALPICQYGYFQDFSDVRAVFRNQNSTESVACSPDINASKRKITKGGVCDLSYWNRAMPWLCRKPRNTNISCMNMVRIARNWGNYTVSLKQCEQEIDDRWSSAPTTLNVTIISKRSTDDQPRTECTYYNTTKLWYNTEPTGYFYGGQWKPRHCKGITIFNGECFRNKRIYLWGDSTVFQWFRFIRIHAQCKCKPKGWKVKWMQKKSCYCIKYNSSLVWFPHYMPFIRGTKGGPKQWKSLYQQWSNDYRFDYTECILVVHLYAHIQMYSLAFFANHLFQLRQDIETIVNHGVKLTVFIKLPHTHREERHEEWMIRQPDIIGYLYTDLIRTVFAGLYHKVIMLNNRDITTAVKSLSLHPSGMVVGAMVGELQSYICNISDVTNQ